ncbi:MAG: hypothetical protein ACYS6K_03825 [Planctomycetota bacterium]|jgi:hypothetical protein
MSKNLICLFLLIAVFAVSAQAQFISDVAHRNTDTDATEEPEIAPNVLGENELTFVDRSHVYADIPESVLGAQYVKLANDNKNMSSYELDLTFIANATLYVFVDNRMGSSGGGKDVDPDITGMPWLNDMGFIDIGEDIGIDESFDGDIDQYFSIYSLPAAAGSTVTIFGNTEGHGGNMLGVAALGPKFKAYNPIPADGAYHEDTWVNLSWTPGDFAASHDVYLGDNFDAVSEGAEGTFIGNQAAAFLVAGFPGFPYPDGLLSGATYYWRVDEVNDADSGSPWKGDVWSFMIPPKTAYLPDPADSGESVAVNARLSWTPGYGSKLHTVYFGDNFDDVNNAAGGLPQGAANYTPGELKMAKTYYWRVDEFDAITTYKGNVWSFTTEGAVAALDPANGAVDVTQTPVLTWAPGFGASHEVYFGADASALEKKAGGNLGSESYEPGQLEWNTTYYWRVDEVNNANADSPWTGPLWSFTTANFLIIDDMEAYNDIAEGEEGSNRIYNAWVDGYDDPTNGSQAGHLDPPFYEESIVHGGGKSLPLYYDNAVGKSEATLTLTDKRDWTVNGVNTLTIWFRGSAANAAETMYVTLNGSASVDNDNPDAALATIWTEWNIPLQAFADQGVNLSNVNSITIGLRSVTGGTGTMYIDDIRLIAP